MIKRNSWKTRFGFYLVAIGSACGLGNLWRFPFIVGENGGGVFVLLFVLLTLVVGLPMLIAELILGKVTRKGILMATYDLDKRRHGPWVWFGRLALLISIFVFSYYSVISGWVMHYFVQFSSAFIGVKTIDNSVMLSFLLDNGFIQLLLASAHILITLTIVNKGIQEGLEKWMSYTTPLFAILLFILMYQTLSLPTSSDVMRFLFYPDFSKMSLSSLMDALGHVLFTLSVGFGTMVTFGSYLSEEDHIPSAAIRVASFDSILSLLAGIVVFGIVIGTAQTKMTDPSLLFDSVPNYLLKVRGGVLFGVAFFICLYMAALSASISLFEMMVSNLSDKLKLTRFQASWIAAIVALVLSILPALSSSYFRDVHILDRSLLEFLDWLMINWMLPIIAIGISFAVRKLLTEQEKKDQFIDTKKFFTVALFGDWLFALKWIAPIVTIVVLVLQVLDILLKYINF